jgi:8-oxo-dGTP pyrophosphatase MutT (NUDIX family)
MQLLKTIEFEKIAPEELVEYRARQAARAVVFDNEGKVALLFVSKKNYHKLPGGGIEEGENIEEALRRECREEIGCEIKITGEIGRIIEYRPKWKIRQESFCYSAEVIGGKGEPSFTEGEKELEFSILWTGMDEAIKILEEEKPEDYQGKFILDRELSFLREVQK